MDKTKFLTLIVIILVLLNIGTLGYLLLRKDNNRTPMRGKGGPAAFIIKKLEFTPDQEQKFVALRDEHHLRMVELSDSLRDLRDEYFNGLKTSNVDTALANRQTEIITGIETEMHNITFNHFVEVRKLCTPHQQELFDTFINDILHSMQPPGPGAPPRGRRR
jgi:periplasmic protein CpxP/Spy